MDARPAIRTTTRIAIAALLALVATAALGAAQAGARVLRVGTFHGIAGQYSTIQSAVDAAHAGDWILVAPGDYHEQGVRGSKAGVLIRRPRIHLRGMNRNRVVVDGTKPGAGECSSRRSDQQVTRKGRNGIVVLKADGVYIENLTVCNYLTKLIPDEGNQIWWNGGDGTGKIGMRSWWGDYLTGTSTFSRGYKVPYGRYGVFVSNARGPGKIDHSYGSNMGDAAFYIGACPDCNGLLTHAHGQYSALGYSGTNSGGHLIIENSEFDHNKSGLTANSQNNDDAPGPSNGACPGGAKGPLGNGICEIWRNNLVHDNNVANVPGNAPTGLAGEVPVGSGVVLGGTRNIEVTRNRIYNQSAWGVVVADLPDQETPPSIAHCDGGTYLVPPPADPPTCYYEAFGNVVAANTFAQNGSFRQPTNADIILYAEQHDPGNCITGNIDMGGITSEPAGLQSSPFEPCGQANGSTTNAALGQLVCGLHLGPCPPGTMYPKPKKSFALHRAPAQPTMPNPCKGVPSNPWCRAG
jgi:hypothetical protein